MRKHLVSAMLVMLWTTQLSIAEEIAVENDVSAADVEAATKKLTDRPTDAEPIDEITVMGARPLLLLHHQVSAAELNFYNRFNEVNTDDRYDVICKDEVHLGSRIPVRECISRVIRDLKIEATQTAILVGSNPARNNPHILNRSEHDRILQEKLQTFVISDQELQDKLMEYDTLRRKYAEEREKKYGDEKETASGD